MRLAGIGILLVLLLSAGCTGGAMEPSANKPPRCSVTSPDPYSTFAFGDTIRFEGMAADAEDVRLSDEALAWESDQDGPLGTGPALERWDLSPNDHLVRFIAVDSAGARDTAGVWVRIEAPAPPDTTIRILFVGGSYFNVNDLPEQLADLAGDGGYGVEIGRVAVNGMFLDEHVESPDTEAMITSAEWDFVVLQGVCTNAGYPGEDDLFPPYESHPLEPALQALKQKILAHGAETQVVYCMAWAFENGTAGIEGYSDDYFEMQQKVYDNTLLYGDSVGLAIAPVGWAWRSVLLTEPRPHYLHQNDSDLPSARGSYLAACTIYATLFQASPVGLSSGGGLTAEDAADFQAVAATVVLDDLELWNITPAP